jgi:hypothetical protein
MAMNKLRSSLMRYLFGLIAAGTLSVLASNTAGAQQCSQCSQVQAAGERSCEAINEPDRYNYCIRQAQNAAARCFRTCTNYNGIGPANPPQGRAVR